MRSKPLILIALLLAAFLVNLDTTMVIVALWRSPAGPVMRWACRSAAAAVRTARRLGRR